MSRTTTPEAPTRLTGRSWRHVVRRTVREFINDECVDHAAALTFYAVLALAPAMIALLSLVGLIGERQRTVDTLLDVVDDVGASSAVDTVEPVLNSLAGASGAGLALVIGLAVALWSASGYVTAFGRAMNRIYDVDEGRPIWKLRPMMLLLTLCLTVLSALALLTLILSGPVARAVGSAIGLGDTAVLIWQIAKWPLLVALVVVIVAVLYYATPNVRQPRFRWLSVGAAAAILVWAIASAAFGFYVDNFSSYNRTYGAMAGVIVFLLWLWITNLALLFGAELDAEMERARELQAGMPAEDEIQLPKRDTTAIEKERRRHRGDLERGRRLRRERGGQPKHEGEAHH